MGKPNLINSKTVFIATIIVVPTLLLLVYASGLQQHRTFYLNSLLSTTILSVVFLVFITVGLYNGWKLKDGLGNFLNKFHLWKKPLEKETDVKVESIDTNVFSSGDEEVILLSLLVWVIVGLFGSIIFWWLGAIVWGTILTLAGILYWIVFRALRLIFKRSPSCAGNLFKSLLTALVFTCLYNSWVYAIILGAHYLKG